ncbi:MAG: hypothetical protein SFV15_20465 [Polyangiaceae bacterium]|nr:hypothetical protein [Polyangiaceae bacterium]
MVRSCIVWGACLLALSCGSVEPGATPVVEPDVVSVELGIPAGDGLDFAPIKDGDELYVQTFGQGGTHVLVGVRCLGFGSRAFISAELTNLSTGVQVEEPAPARPQLLYCTEGGPCDLVPYLVHTSGLVPSGVKGAGVHARLRIKARTEAGLQAEGEREVLLNTSNL